MLPSTFKLADPNKALTQVKVPQPRVQRAVARLQSLLEGYRQNGKKVQGTLPLHQVITLFIDRQG
ncbi:hypothetical protein NG99_15210 [Erwinia typographi]|uniref:Uncharacterized protein n=1 Tax=Erwinia typographi TaxID=371042 RepID=A0A0A4A1V3_9GAMM|nr:hypothetical protein NG99_15210 [Erwinia typographi]